MKLRTAHISMPLSESQKADELFNNALVRRYAWITGVEGDDDVIPELCKIAVNSGYVFWSSEDPACWIAVRSDLLVGELVGDVSHGIQPPLLEDHSETLVEDEIHISFNTDLLGQVYVGDWNNDAPPLSLNNLAQTGYTQSMDLGYGLIEVTYSLK